jgi:alanine racemase
MPRPGGQLASARSVERRGRAGAAVKADAYGLGAARVVPILAQAGCRDWFVAHWCEVPDLLPHVPPASIHVLHGPMNAADVAYARATGVTPVLNSLAQVQRWREAGGGLCDLMVDTGINRLGLPLADLGDPALAGLDIDCCISHLASADEDVAQNAQQLERFNAVRAQVPARRYSLANSAGIALGAPWHADLTRPGIALYGGIVRSELAGVIAPVARPQAAVIQRRQLSAETAWAITPPSWPTVRSRRPWWRSAMPTDTCAHGLAGANLCGRAGPCPCSAGSRWI